MLAQNMGNNVLKVNLKSSHQMDGEFATAIVNQKRDELRVDIDKISELSRDIQYMFDDAIHAVDYKNLKNILIQLADAAWAAHYNLIKDDGNVVDYLETLNHEDPNAYQEYLRCYRGFCDEHQEAYQEMYTGTYMCESCHDGIKAPGVCTCCHEYGDIVTRGYCHTCYEVYSDEVQS